MARRSDGAGRRAMTDAALLTRREDSGSSTWVHGPRHRVKHSFRVCMATTAREKRCHAAQRRHMGDGARARFAFHHFSVAGRQTRPDIHTTLTTLFSDTTEPCTCCALVTRQRRYYGEIQFYRTWVMAVPFIVWFA